MGGSNGLVDKLNKLLEIFLHVVKKILKQDQNILNTINQFECNF